MGTIESKLATKPPPSEVQEGSIPSTPILTTKIFKPDVNREIDPRSPSQHIARTPIQLLTAAAKQLEALETSECEDKNDNQAPTKNYLVLGVDPRSPTTDFQRTPIVISATPDNKLLTKLHNKNFDNVHKSTILTPRWKSEIIPPKLLESSPITSKPDANKRKSFVGLLETNIDFTETDLDQAIKEKCLSKLFTSSAKQEVVSVMKTKNIDPRSPTTDFVRTPIQISKRIQEIEDIEELNSGSDNENVKETDENLEILEELQYYNIQNEVEKIEELVTIKNDKVTLKTAYRNPQESQSVPVSPLVAPDSPKSVQSKETKSVPISPVVIAMTSSKTVKSELITAPFINLTADVKELDKKLSNLIYQDEDIVICPRNVVLKEQSRTPLGDRNSSEPRKSTQKLKVSDKPRKSEFAVSKIPLYKEKKSKNMVQCENTPPRTLEKRKLKQRKPHWDNNTLVI